ncbi:heptose-I-phosphate ethanolaminephosphotransferase [Sinobacterium caligoides]|uniref:Heptose-I-phosphate ethanolaminephosphotransferase n=1 Tax=Sinobacterium caligoides TaxID=933926 RepID=A0A3N2DNG3_9GAMM|nr:phosphoethanolamine transferase CptA [Sinobacterium caligoides]ROS01189.1 heptose-I-phosphate ethanolaminephosphotransferase [Sinobacterium caligoides]
MSKLLNPQQQTLMKTYGTLLAFFLLATIPYQACVFFSGQTSIGQFLTAIGLSAIWIIPVYFAPVITKPYCAIMGGLFTLLSALKLSYFMLYGTAITQSTLFIAFDSNSHEGSEFIISYLRWWIPLLTLGYIVVMTLLWRKIERPQGVKGERPYLIFSLIILLSFSLPIIHKGLKDGGTSAASFKRFHKRLGFATPFTIPTSYLAYRQQLSNMEALIDHADTVPPVKDLVDTEADKAKTVVLVIGESTDRHRMGLYGYSRNTNPELNKIKGQLDIFNNVYTARPYTIETLEQVLSFADERHPNLYMKQPTLIAMMKQAGYKTFWITNQQTLTQRNTMLTFFSQQADEQAYLNNNDKQNLASYDEKVLLPFKKALQDTAKKKLIVVHLLGTHRDYKYRYTAPFDHFQSKQGITTSVALNKDQVKTYNQYDNAVLYNDWLLSQLINDYKTTSPYGMLVYFSDHGEEVYDYRSYEGRDESNPSEYMYSIPFFVWRSPSWKAAHPADWHAYQDRLYSSQHFISTFSDMIGLRFKGQRFDRSLISPHYKPSEVLVGNPNAPSTLRDIRRQPLPG